MKHILAPIVLLTFLFPSLAFGEIVSLICKHFKTTYFCMYNSENKYCSRDSAESSIAGEATLVINTKTKTLTFNQIENIPYLISGSGLSFQLSAPLGDDPLFYELHFFLNKVNGEMATSYRMNISGHDNKHMYPDRDDRGYATSYTQYARCDRRKPLF